MLNSNVDVEKVRREFSKGTRVKLIHMEDKYAVESETEGTVLFVDDMGQIHVNWDSGRGLALIPEVDKFIKVN